MERWRAALGLVLASAVVGGALAVRAARADPLLRAVPLAGQPIAVVVDERMSRAFVLDHGTNVSAGTVTVLDARSGNVLRTVYAGVAPWAAAVDGRTARAFVLDVASHGATMLDTRSGAVLAAFPVFPFPRSIDPTLGTVQTTVVTAVAVDEARGQAFVAVGSSYPSVGGGVTVLDARSGRLERVLRVTEGAMSLAVDPSGGGLIILDDVADSVNWVDARTGALLHSTSLGRNPVAMAVDWGTQRLFVATEASGSSSGRGTLDVLDARTGQMLRTVPVGVAPTALAVDEQGGRVFVASAGSLDSQGRYAGDGGVSLLDARTGALVGSVATAQSPRVLAVDAQAQRIFVATHGDLALPGSLLVLDARTGALLRTIAIGPSPTALAVDQREGRVFVTDTGGPLSTPQAGLWLPDSLRRWAPFWPAQQSSTRTVPASVTILDAAG